MQKLKLKLIVQEQKTFLLNNVIQRNIWQEIIKQYNNPFVTIISGIRRCGKSTLLHQLREYKKGYYLNFDDERLINFSVDDFQKLYEIFYEIYGDLDIFYFDEIQNIPKWEFFVRRLRDQNKKVFVTGSNASMLSKELGTHLTGRYISFVLFPFSFKEFLVFNKFKLGKDSFLTTKGITTLKSLFDKFFQKGGFPEYLKTDNQEYLKTLYENILYRDILVRYNLRNEKVLKELIYFVNSNIGKLISFNSLKKLLSLGSATTIKEYFDYLENSFLLFLVSRFDKSSKKQIYSNKKVYCIDNALTLITGFRTSKDNGRILENTVFLELKRRNNEIFYYKEDSECDFVLKKGPNIHQAIQVCYDLNEDNKQREIKGLLDAMKKFKLKKGLLITYDQEETINEDNKKIRIIPIWKWLLEHHS